MSDQAYNSVGSTVEFDALIVGAGFAGLYMLHRLRGLGFAARVIEAGTGVGGTWFWNRYPGARCDVESLEYQYSFSDELQREWNWTERYATQPEILNYMNHVADRFDLRKDIQFATRVTSAIFDEVTTRWVVETDRGDRVMARFCIMATGCLSASRVPDFKGLETFVGPWYHTGQWPHDGVDFSGQRVGIIGTGSSAIQAIPIIAAQASQLVVFQRTPNFSLPAENDRLTPEYVRDYKDRFAAIRTMARASVFGLALEAGGKSALEVSTEERQQEYERRWSKGGFDFLAAFADLLVNDQANATAAEFVRTKIRQTVQNPEVAEALAPQDHPLGTKRICIDTHYYQTYNRDNVTLVNLRSNPIEAITPRGIRTLNGEYAVDTIVFATGFDAMTGPLLNIDIRGRGGEELRTKWAAGPRTYLGLAIAGFPNLFTITGPGSPSVLSNMLVSIEQHVDWIADCMDSLRAHGWTTIEATREAEDAWGAHVNEVANHTLFPQANSWYVGANIPGKPRVFMPYAGGVGLYAQKCREIAANDYQGFTIGRDTPVVSAIIRSPCRT